MIGRIVEIAEDRRYLFVSRGFMVIREIGGDGQELGRIPLDDIAAVIAHAHGLTYSNNLLVALAERGAPFVVCGANHNVAAMLWPVDGNFQQAKRYDAQIAASKPVHKRLWAELIRAKLSRQAAVLEAIGAPSAPLASLVNQVRSGDTGNIEAQGARRYWRLLLGDDFRRDQSGNGINALLNYGYTVYRAAVARAITAAGLHPTLGVHHQNEGNPMRLADDLIEPFRPLVDLLVWQCKQRGELELTADIKRKIAKSLYADMATQAGATPIIVCMQKLAVSLAQIYLGEKSELELPFQGVPSVFSTNPAIRKDQC
ncbi:type II CRISPR-associated endonuclease Cas1 [Chromatiaceae bacterium AAb-1]|nr:type II CRISPR-associated endonuclease Cas1 [Chromatiaceae bacterium AAb-1]